MSHVTPQFELCFMTNLEPKGAHLRLCCILNGLSKSRVSCAQETGAGHSSELPWHREQVLIDTRKEQFSKTLTNKTECNCSENNPALDA